MLLCDCCKNVKNVMVVRYYVATIPTYEYNDFKLPQPKKDEMNSIDLCGQCVNKLNDFIGQAVYNVRQGNSFRDVLK